MTAPVVQVDFEQMEEVANRFGQQAELAGDLLRQVQTSMAPLQNGGWVGLGSNAFFEEMDGEVLPAVKRLQDALATAQLTVNQINELMRSAEEEAGGLFQAEAAGSGRGAGVGGGGGNGGLAGFGGDSGFSTDGVGSSGGASEFGNTGRGTVSGAEGRSLDRVITRIADRLGDLFGRIMNSGTTMPFQASSNFNNLAGFVDRLNFDSRSFSTFVPENSGWSQANDGSFPFSMAGWNNFPISTADSSWSNKFSASDMMVPRDWLADVADAFDLDGFGGNSWNGFGLPTDWLSGGLSDFFADNGNRGLSVPSNWLDDTFQAVEQDIDEAMSGQPTASSGSGGGQTSEESSQSGGGGGGGQTSEKSSQSGGGGGGGGQPEQPTEPETADDKQSREDMAGSGILPADTPSSPTNVVSPYGSSRGSYSGGSSGVMGDISAETTTEGQGFRHSGFGGGGGGVTASATPTPTSIGGLYSGGGSVGTPSSTEPQLGLSLASLGLVSPFAALLGKTLINKLNKED